MVKQPWREVGSQIAAGSSLHQNTCQIRAHVAVEELCPRYIYKRKGEAHLHPVVFRVEWALFSHELRLLFAQTHGQQIADRRPGQMVADLFRQVFGKCLRQLLIQREQSFLDGKSHRTACETFGGRVNVAPHLRFAVPVGNQRVILCDLQSENAQRGGNLYKFFNIHRSLYLPVYRSLYFFIHRSLYLFFIDHCIFLIHFSESQRFSYQNHLDPIRIPGDSRGDEGRADGRSGRTFRTESGLRTRCVEIQAGRVRWTGILTDPCIGVLHRRYHLVHAHHDDDVGRTETEVADPVAVAVDVDQLAVGSEGVGAHEIIVRHGDSGMELSCLLWILRQRAVDEGVILRMFLDIVQQTDLLDGGGAAAADDRALLNEGDGLLKRLLLCRAVECLKVSSFHLSVHTFRLHGVC